MFDVIVDLHFERAKAAVARADRCITRLVDGAEPQGGVDGHDGRRTGVDEQAHRGSGDARRRVEHGGRNCETSRGVVQASQQGRCCIARAPRRRELTLDVRGGHVAPSRQRRRFAPSVDGRAVELDANADVQDGSLSDRLSRHPERPAQRQTTLHDLELVQGRAFHRALDHGLEVYRLSGHRTMVRNGRVITEWATNKTRVSGT